MPWRQMSVMEQKEEFILLFKSGKYTVNALAQMFEISRPTAYKYIHRYQTFGVPGLLELGRTPHRIPNKTPDRIEQEIIRLRTRHPRWDAPKLRVLLEDRVRHSTPDRRMSVGMRKGITYAAADTGAPEFLVTRRL